MVPENQLDREIQSKIIRGPGAEHGGQAPKKIRDLGRRSPVRCMFFSEFQYRIDHISKTKSHTKKIYDIKNYFQSNAHLSCKFGNF